jgi:hypothetical protein
MKERDVLTVNFFPQKIAFSKFTPEAHLKQIIAEDMLHLLQQPTASPTATPLAFVPSKLNAHAKTADVLRRATPSPPPMLPAQLPPAAPLPALDPILTPPASVPRVLLPLAPAAPQRVPNALRCQAPILQSKKFHPNNKPSTFLLLHTHQLVNVSPRFSTHRTQRLGLAQSYLQCDPTVAGKMCDPVTGRGAETSNTLLRGPNQPVWTHLSSNEWGRCAQGVSKNCPPDKHVIGDDTVCFIPPHRVPIGHKVTHANFVCTMGPGEAEPDRIRMTVGGDRSDAFQDARTPAACIVDISLHIASTVSDAKHGARCCTGDLENLFLVVSDMQIFQPMQAHRRCVPQEIIDACGLTDKHFDSKGHVHLEICKGMHGLKEASILAHDQLKAHLAPCGHAPVRFFTPGLWNGNAHRTTFTLAVDDFGIRYFSKTDADHPFSALHEKHALTKDWTGTS